jgi:parallel beta-helix repeat protein
MKSFGIGRMVALAGVAVGAFISVSGVASAQCARTILKCGCTITAGGLFTLGNPVANSASGAGDCIAIRAKNVVLNLNGYSITGPSNGTAKGSGVHILKSASGAFVEGLGATISGWANGVETESTNGTIDNIVTGSNDKAGVFLFKANNNHVTRISADGNGQFGIFVSASAQNDIAASEASDNGADGVLVGCIANSTGGCAVQSKPSNSNDVYAVASDNNGRDGIAVQFNSNRNNVANCSASGNTRFDMDDRHPNGCALDQWFANSFTTASRTCIQ